MALSEEVLDMLTTLHERADPGPWTAMVEGRDHVSGDSFIQVGEDGDRREDMYVTRDSGPADVTTLDLIAAVRTYLPVLVQEIRRLRGADGA
jgi:hypothetical protein